MIELNVTNLVGGNIVITSPQPGVPRGEPSLYFTYNSDGFITGLVQDAPNDFEEQIVEDWDNWDGENEVPMITYSGYVLGSPNKSIEDPYALGVSNNGLANWDYGEHSIPPDKGMSSISLPNATSIGNGAFAYTGLNSISIPNVTTIGSSVFYYCGISSINLPNIQSIGENAFFCCISLENVSIGSNIQSIGSNAFYTESMGQPITLTIGKSTSEVEAMNYQDWGLRSYSSIVCTNGTISIGE